MKEKVIEIISEVLRVEPAVVTPELSVGEIPEWSSIAQLAIVAALEERLGVEIPLEDLFELASVGALVAEVEKLTGVER